MEIIDLKPPANRIPETTATFRARSESANRCESMDEGVTSEVSFSSESEGGHFRNFRLVSQPSQSLPPFNLRYYHLIDITRPKHAKTRITFHHLNLHLSLEGSAVKGGYCHDRVRSRPYSTLSDPYRLLSTPIDTIDTIDYSISRSTCNRLARSLRLFSISVPLCLCLSSL